MIKLKDILNEDRKSDLEDIFHPHRYWKDFRGTLRKGIDNKLKMEATIGSNTAHFPFFSTTMGVSTRTVQPRSHGIVDPKLLSKTRIMISVLTEDKYQKVIEGDKIKLSTKGLMSIVMEVEKSHGDDVFYIRDSQLKWFHPFKNTMFSMDLGLGTAEGFDGKLVDYIEKEIKFAVKKRGNRIRGARFRVV
jgi:hypothetical protein